MRPRTSADSMHTYVLPRDMLCGGGLENSTIIIAVSVLTNYRLWACKVIPSRFFFCFHFHFCFCFSPSAFTFLRIFILLTLPIAFFVPLHSSQGLSSTQSQFLIKIYPEMKIHFHFRVTVPGGIA